MIDIDDNTRPPLPYDRNDIARPIASRRPPQRVGPDAIDVACIIAGAVLFLAVVGSACALLYVAATLLGKV